MTLEDELNYYIDWLSELTERRDGLDEKIRQAECEVKRIRELIEIRNG